MYQQQQRKPLTQKQLKTMLKNCEYISHIIFPYECQSALEDLSCKSLITMYKQDTNQQDGDMQSQTQNIMRKVEQFHLILDSRVKEFHSICVELFYFIFSCLQHQLCIAFHEEFLVYSGERDKFMVVIKQLSIFSEQQKQQQKKKAKSFYKLFTLVVNDITNILQHHIEFIKKYINQFNMEKDIKLQKIKRFNMQQFDFKQKDVNIMLRFIRDMLSDAYSVRDHCNTDFQCFCEFEKCEFVRSCSYLYKINNSSINIILFRAAAEKDQDKLKNAILNQNKLVKKYRQTKLSERGSEEELFDIYRKIVFSFYKYVQENWKTNPLYKTIPQQNSPQLQIFMEEKQKKQSKSDSKIIFKTIIKPINKKFQYGNNTKPVQKPPKQPAEEMLEYYIEYNITKCIIIVRLYTPIMLEHHNMDAVIHNWNSLAFSSQSITLELCQRSEVINKKKKFLVIKSSNNYKMGDNLTFQFFRYIDITMVGYRIMQEQIKKEATGIFSSYKANQLDEIFKKINHYTQLMCELNNKLFNSIKT